MDDSTDLPSNEDVAERVGSEAREAVRACLERDGSTSAEDRKRALRALRTLAAERPAAVAPHLAELVPFLTDEERAVRLTTAKLFVAVAESDPAAVVPSVRPLADRLADEEEFYYVRARSAEALGYVALETPAAVTTPEILADLRVGLSFDEPEVKEKLAKALEFVAVGDPARLRYHLSTLAAHLDDENALVRYHLSTALVAVGCEFPNALEDVRAELDARLGDDDPFVRGRAAEARGLLGRTGASPPNEELERLCDDEEPFVSVRANFALEALTGESDSRESARAEDEEGPTPVGTVESVRETTGDASAAITAPESECPHCGYPLPDAGPPLCPQCGGPH